MKAVSGHERAVFEQITPPATCYRFSIITPTYNRASLLTRVYESLRAQTFRNFEWIIVDDGSTDGTDKLVLSWKAPFPIRYFWQFNQGMHAALNLGTAVAEGEFITQIDSDDACIPTALERFDCRWREIPNPEKYGALVGLCYQADGQTLLGDPLREDYIDCFSLREALAANGEVDRWGIIRTDVCREFLFPIFPEEKFLIPGVVYNRIRSRYATRYFNEPLKIACYAPGHMSSMDLRWSNPRGAFLFHRELALADVPLGVRLASAINALRFAPAAVYRGLRNLVTHAHAVQPFRERTSTTSRAGIRDGTV